jgi:hypothetical protein
MGQKIKADVLQALDDWNAGKPVQSIELGHVHRMKEHPGGAPFIDFSKRLPTEQERAHAYCFHLIGLFKLNGVPESHELFLDACDEYEELFREDDATLTAEELDGAESLAWKALLVGWKRAIDGHADGRYIEVTKPEVAAT